MPVAMVLLGLVGWPARAGAQHLMVGPQAVLVDYREVSCGPPYPGSGRDGLVPRQLPRGTEVFRRRPRVVLHRSRARPRRAPRRSAARRGGLRVRAREPQDESGWDRGDRRADSANAGAPGAGDSLLGGDATIL